MNRFNLSLGMILPFLGLIFVTALFAVAISIFEPDSFEVFMSLQNFKTVAMQMAIVGIGALGMTMVIISGGIDLSAGSLVALSTVVLAVVIDIGSTGTYAGGDWQVSGAWVVVAVIAAVVACSAFGFFNGYITTKMSIVPFIVTLGTMQIARGCAEWFASNEMVRTPDNFLKSFMDPQPDPAILFFAPGVWILLLLAFIVYVTLRYTVFGRYIYAIGSSENTARLCGVNVKKIRILIYTLSGSFMGMAGAMQYATLGSGSPTEAVGLELDIIAAVVIGGGSLDGGEGSAIGTLVGAMIMSVLRSGCVMLGVPSFVQKIIIGSIIIAAVGLDRMKHKKVGT
jgi:ribose/xylose/arabinose/galactoside ABC-type transport system permease subunit